MRRAAAFARVGGPDPCGIPLLINGAVPAPGRAAARRIVTGVTAIGGRAYSISTGSNFVSRNKLWVNVSGGGG